jgi:hypothetical protein
MHNNLGDHRLAPNRFWSPLGKQDGGRAVGELLPDAQLHAPTDDARHPGRSPHLGLTGRDAF